MVSDCVTRLAICLVLLGAGRAFGEPAAKLSAAHSVEVFQGELAELKIAGHGLSAVEAKMGAESIPFYPNTDGAFTALVGVDLEAAPGWAKVLVRTTTRAGTHRQTRIMLKIKPKSFPQESFSVATEFEPFGPEVLERIRREQKQFSSVFALSTPQRLWDGPFVPPVAGGVTSPFGFRRVINGIPRAPHTGVDLKAPLGTEVLAANHGRVALVGDFFFSGKSLVLDHGGGLYTSYFHLSEFKVDAGSEIRKGEVVALSGMTGRVTGPHLHWGARINGARVDPFNLIEKLARNPEKPRRSNAKAGGGEN